jgi:predicted transcriptional regulator of viral defense system
MLPQDKRKTLGPQAAHLGAELYERGRRVFSLRDVEEVAGLTGSSVRTFMSKLVGRGVAARLRPGLFVLVPPELGRAVEYAGNPYVIARELAGGRDYFLSHASAMDVHRMTTQPQLVVYATTRRPIRPRQVMGTEFRFVEAGQGGFFGTTDYWAEKQEQVRVATIERTVIDGLRRPKYCGGIVEVAKGLWMRRTDADPGRLVEYALRVGSGVVVRRLGFLMEQ